MGQCIGQATITENRARVVLNVVLPRADGPAIHQTGIGIIVRPRQGGAATFHLFFDDGARDLGAGVKAPVIQMINQGGFANTGTPGNDNKVGRYWCLHSCSCLRKHAVLVGLCGKGMAILLLVLGIAPLAQDRLFTGLVWQVNGKEKVRVGKGAGRVFKRSLRSR